MPQCAVATCRNSHRRTRRQAVRYHRFPHNPELRKRWVTACGRESLTNGEPPFNINTARICSRHFLEEFYEDESREQIMQGNQKRNRLRSGAVPTIDVPIPVQPCFKLLRETEKKRSGTRVKASNGANMAVSDKPDAQRSCKRACEDENGGEDTKTVLPIVNERAERNVLNQRKYLKLDQEGFLMAIGLIPVESVCLNKMHAMEGVAESKRKVDTAEDDKTSRSSPSPKVPQSQQNGAALPEETAAAPTASMGRARIKKDESHSEIEAPKGRQLLASTSRQSASIPRDVVQPRHVKAGSEPVEIRKRKSTNGQLASPGNPRKKFRDNYTREEYISKIVGGDNNETIEELVAKAERLRVDILALQNLAHAKEMEWNEILRKRKLKEEAYLRLERKIRTTSYMENDSQLPETLSSARSSLGLAEWENTISVSKEISFEYKEDPGEKSLDSPCVKKEKTTKLSSQQRATPPKTNGENNRKQNEASSPESRQIGEGRQGAIVDVRSIIADHRLKHPETVPRRGRRMRNSNVNINLGTGGAMVETGLNADSRPSSTESCKSNPSASDSMNYKDMLVQFAKLSQQGGESVKVPQNYPDVTLHPVTPTSAQNTSQPTGSLLHGILTKAQTPRSTTFSPTLARLLTAPERERNSSATVAAAAAASVSMSQQNATTQHLLQTYQGSNLVSINDLLSSSKARTEITITPVVNTSAQSHSNDLIHVEDVEEDTTVIDDRKGNSVVGRDSKQPVKDNPPSPSAPPKCQGCIIRPAQFVCAGCGNQWYCSRSCQLAAWATHSDHCPPEPENSKTKSNV
ncbi:uncharacterized protein LOC105832542 isoform X3 [Monomorium pharaonis]|uniref:uncharacterized protein LOC105832542 isoform X3 n=1 Tax=Monomorium pharaonis TaxID=307658 RepID=UPI00174636A3|nr:uncharacterized protein LOC105832542 isoform X3 [Monomorium pharaonis]XP_036142798.1 uncharacterized protein LOC105832542 isoform X3 [Monomorium pharaonis]XP_036142799.1 uncharacterized protein LOC105832542 isoform X3 [Monomorium pharaonis]